jgi:glutamate-1-semialdehyde 2,1-aminomutase
LRIDGSSTARVGSLLTLFFRDRAPKNFREAKQSDTAAFAKFFQRMRNAGILLPPSQFEAWFLSAAHDDAVIDATIAAAAD